jgi:ADP-heptose:LPS heptosyltransferase
MPGWQRGRLLIRRIPVRVRPNESFRPAWLLYAQPSGKGLVSGIMMSVKAIRRIDRWIGIPICFALTGLRRLIERGKHAHVPRLRAILFLKLAEQGSTVLVCDAIRRAIGLVGRDNVYFLVFEENRFILDVMALLPRENVLAIRRDNLLTAALDTLRAVRSLRKRRINATIDCEFFARFSAAISFLIGSDYRVGLHAAGGEGPYRGDLMTHRLRYNPYLHTAETFRVMVEALTFAPTDLAPLDMKPALASDSLPIFEPTRAEVLEVQALLRKAARTEAPLSLILLNPNCSDLLPLRRWPVEKYVELGRRLTARYPGLHVALTGQPSEAQGAAALTQEIASERCFSLAGRTTLRQLLVIFGLADVLVTNDSGPAHFAALTPIDVVTLFGPETPQLYQARTPRSHVFWAQLACSPCVSPLNHKQSSCQNNLCMQRIEVDTVFDKVCEIYEARINAQAVANCNHRVGRLQVGV